MKKVAVFCIPAHGHTNPMLAVVKELVSRGDEVRFYSFSEFREKIERTGAAFIGCDRFLPELSTKEEENLDYQSWKDEADDTVKLIFGDKSSYYTNIHEVLNPSFCGSISFGTHEHIDYKAIYLRRLDSLDSKLGSLQNVVDLSEDDGPELADPIENMAEQREIVDTSEIDVDSLNEPEDLKSTLKSMLQTDEEDDMDDEDDFEFIDLD